MADNFQLFAESLNNLTLAERDWVRAVLNVEKDRHGRATQRVENVLKEAGIDPADEFCYWPDFDWSIAPEEENPEAFELILYSEDHGSVSNAAEFVRAFLAKFRAKDCFAIHWAKTSSKPSVGEFGGGAMFVTANGIQVMRLDDWTAERRKKHEAAPPPPQPQRVWYTEVLKPLTGEEAKQV